MIGYAYLWRDEAKRGQIEGRKERPAVIVLSVTRQDERTVVTVAPITHSPPARAELAVEIPPATKRRLGLDDERSWIVTDDLNQFVWPGVDLRPVNRGAQTFAFGLLPAALYEEVRRRILAVARAGQASLTRRSE